MHGRVCNMKGYEFTVLNLVLNGYSLKSAEDFDSLELRLEVLNLVLNGYSLKLKI